MMTMKKWNQLAISLILLLNTGWLIYLIVSGIQSRILVTLSVYLIIWVPKIARSLLKIDVPERMEFIYIIFIFLAQFLGSVVGLYSVIYWYDSFTHFLSGILTAFLGLSILNWFRKYDKNSISFNIFFILAFSLMAASMWEMFEFTSDRILSGDTQKVIETGVTDTMKDMIVAFLGAIIVSITYAYEKVMKKGKLFQKLEKEFGCKNE